MHGEIPTFEYMFWCSQVPCSEKPYIRTKRDISTLVWMVDKIVDERTLVAFDVFACATSRPLLRHLQFKLQMGQVVGSSSLTKRAWNDGGGVEASERRLGIV